MSTEHRDELYAIVFPCIFRPNKVRLFQAIRLNLTEVISPSSHLKRRFRVCFALWP